MHLQPAAAALALPLQIGWGIVDEETNQATHQLSNQRNLPRSFEDDVDIDLFKLFKLLYSTSLLLYSMGFVG